MNSAPPAKYVHVFPIYHRNLGTEALIEQAERVLEDEGPPGYVLTRCEWHRLGHELVLLADAVPEVRWVRRGLIWQGITPDMEAAS